MPKYTDIELRKKILDKHRSGLNQRTIAEHLQISASTVNYWINRHETLETRKKTGRPRKTTLAMDDAIFLMSQANPFMPTTEIIQQLRLPLKKHAVIQRLKSFGLWSCRPAKKEKLTPIHIRKRLEFAQLYQHWTIDNWKRVIFSDEKVFSTFGKGINRVWRTKRQNRYNVKYLNQIQVSGRVSIPVWACISGTDNYHFIYYIRDGNLTSAKYVQILQRFIRNINDEDEELIFMQDQSSIHKAENTMNWLDMHGINCLDWPAKSPDLNPIENVWAEMERRTSTRHLKTKEELWNLVETTFNDLENSQYINKLIQSMPKRIQSVIDANGHWTKY